MMSLRDLSIRIVLQTLCACAVRSCRRSFAILRKYLLVPFRRTDDFVEGYRLRPRRLVNDLSRRGHRLRILPRIRGW